MPHSDSATLPEPTSSAPLYAEVAVPLRVAQTFTYRLSGSLTDVVRVGSRVIVPFGKSKKITGYVVALHNELDSGLGVSEREVKEVEEILDAEPLLTPE